MITIDKNIIRIDKNNESSKLCYSILFINGGTIIKPEYSR